MKKIRELLSKLFRSRSGDDDATRMDGGFPERFRDLTKSIIQPLRDRTGNIDVRQSISKLIDKDKLRRSADPAAMVAWAQTNLQKRDTSFYVTLLAVILSTFFLADVTSLMIARMIPESAPSAPRPRMSGNQRTERVEDYDVIASRNLFSSKSLIPGEETGAPVDDGGAPVRTTLPINLVGTLVLRDELKSVATIEDKSASAVYPVRVQDEIPSKMKILQIEPYKVTFLNVSTGRREFIDMPEDAPAGPRISIRGGGKPTAGTAIEQVAPNQFTVARTEIDKALGNLSQILTQARAIPHFENGVQAGFKIFQIVPGSIYEKLGIENGDLICGVNGGMPDVSQAMSMMTELKTASRLELCVKKPNGQQKNYAYDIR